MSHAHIFLRYYHASFMAFYLLFLSRLCQIVDDAEFQKINNEFFR